MKHVRWIDPESAEDNSIHFLYDTEWTFCGLAFEGVASNADQGFKVTKDKVTCWQCIHRVQVASKIKLKEMGE